VGNRPPEKGGAGGWPAEAEAEARVVPVERLFLPDALGLGASAGTVAGFLESVGIARFPLRPSFGRPNSLGQGYGRTDLLLAHRLCLPTPVQPVQPLALHA
jgi:hypothetical protein